MKSNQEYRAILDQYIPWGSSTCSKRARFMPEEPAVIVRGKGCRVWDADGREFIDFRNSLGPITLGYCYEPVNEAVKEQLDKGIVFGYPTPLEAEVAELVCHTIPCAEKARFLKTGGEAIAAVIKSARCVSGHDHVIQIGYNGWLNSLGSGGMTLPGQKAADKLPGVPADLTALHHTCGWNDVETMERLGNLYGDNLACVVVAADYLRMDEAKTFYPFLRQFVDKYGAALIYDEIVTGFRLALGGAQELYGVTPDMAVFAKAVANGMPLSVYCGNAKWMKGLDTAIVSSTYGGEALSLAAAKAVINIYRTEPVIEHLWEMGNRMWSGMDRIFEAKGLPFNVPSRKPVGFVNVHADAPAGLFDNFLRACCANGVTLYNGGYVNYSHKAADIDEALERIEKAAASL
ncbi:MAG: aminotransferase class III-fold pyridoxal phosphate-dependent enzyme [Lentisphaeria bacterium]|nr:aminotransferase class III-fold pyridoxal phosphate-dependent enzyme [Lentisphaeria bacterium]